ncbi:MAG: ATP-binding cassette domain-containing protein, partial [Syntrophales bacterium]
MNPILEAKKLSMNFGGLKALYRVDIDVLPRQITALIGPNGAGKTTFFNCITGIYSPTEGDIFITPPDGRQK